MTDLTCIVFFSPNFNQVLCGTCLSPALRITAQKRGIWVEFKGSCIMLTSSSLCAKIRVEVCKYSCDKLLVRFAKWPHLHFKVADNIQKQQLNLDGSWDIKRPINGSRQHDGMKTERLESIFLRTGVINDSFAMFTFKRFHCVMSDQRHGKCASAEPGPEKKAKNGLARLFSTHRWS